MSRCGDGALQASHISEGQVLHPHVPGAAVTGSTAVRYVLAEMRSRCSTPASVIARCGWLEAQDMAGGPGESRDGGAV